MNVSSLVTTFGVIIGSLLAIATAVGIWAAFRVGKNAQTITNYRDAVQSWKERSESQDVKIAEQENEMNDLRDKQHKLEAENADLRGQVAVLRDAISGRQWFDMIVKQLGDQHNEMMGRLDRLAGGR